jgi:Uri superfamily endonuclease
MPSRIYHYHMKPSIMQDGVLDRKTGGAYILILELQRSTELQVGSLGLFHLKNGAYLYIGSAKRGLLGRVERHKRLARLKRGPTQWHIDAFLKNPRVVLKKTLTLQNAHECVISKIIALSEGSEVPVPGFGASDCRRRCTSHFYRVTSKTTINISNLLKNKKMR